MPESALLYTEEGESRDGKASGLPNVKIGRLVQAVEWSRQRLQPFREKRMEFLRQYVGFHYSDDGARDRVPLNLIEMATDIFSRHLVADNPRALVRTKIPRLKAKAHELGLALDHTADEIELGETLFRLAIDGLFSVAVAKIGLNTKSEVEIEGFLHDVGQVFVDRVDLDDLVFDMGARSWEQCGFIGNRYRLPMEEVRSSPYFGNMGDVAPSQDSPFNEGGDEKAETISRGEERYREEYRDYVDLWDLFLPLENEFVTLLGDDSGCPTTKVLHRSRWDGPEGGPYRVLTFSPVPNNIMPLSPAATWIDLHDLANRLFRKLGRQGERQKTILGVQAGALEDGQRVVKASDGDTITVDNPDKAREYKFGGVESNTLAFTTQVKDWFTYMAGNLDALGGLSPQSSTATQDQMLQMNSQRKIARMQERMVNFTKRIMRDIAFYLWNDPLIEIPIIKRVPGANLEIPTVFSPAQQEADLLDFNVSIEPYSMIHHSPGTRLQTIMNVFQGFILPSLPLLQQQGLGVDFDKLIKLISKYSNMNELNELITRPEMDPMAMLGQQAGEGQQPGRPGFTHRINERRNTPGATEGGKDAAMIQALLGGSARLRRIDIEADRMTNVSSKDSKAMKVLYGIAGTVVGGLILLWGGWVSVELFKGDRWTAAEHAEFRAEMVKIHREMDREIQTRITYEVVGRKFDMMDEKLDQVQLDVAWIKAKMNGGQ